MLNTFSAMLKWMAWFKFLLGTLLAVLVATYPAWQDSVTFGFSLNFQMSWLIALLVEILVVITATGMLALSEYLQMAAKVGEDLHIIRRAIDKA